MMSWATLSDNEKNCLIAEKIFSLIPCQSRSYTPLIAGYTEIIRCEHIDLRAAVNRERIFCYDTKRPRNYLTGNGMLEIVGHFRAKGWEVELNIYNEGIGVGFYKGGSGWDSQYVTNYTSPTAPDAVTLAALRAVGIDIKD